MCQGGNDDDAVPDPTNAREIRSIIHEILRDGREPVDQLFPRSPQTRALRSFVCLYFRPPLTKPASSPLPSSSENLSPSSPTAKMVSPSRESRGS